MRVDIRTAVARGREPPAPHRKPATVEAWLRRQQQIEIVALDRGGGCGLAVARALPQAIEVADRWHLMENTSGAFVDAVRNPCGKSACDLGGEHQSRAAHRRRDAAILMLASRNIPIKEQRSDVFRVRRADYSSGARASNGRAENSVARARPRVSGLQYVGRLSLAR